MFKADFKCLVSFHLLQPSPDHIHGGGSRLEEVSGVLNSWDVAEDALPDVLWSK